MMKIERRCIMDIDSLKKLIKEKMEQHAFYVAECMTAKRYFKNQTDITLKGYDKDIDAEHTDNPLRNADNRIPESFHELLVKQKASYAFTYPPLFDVGNDEVNKLIAYTLGDGYRKKCLKLCVNASNYSNAWVHYWKSNKDGSFKWGIVDSMEIIPLYDETLEEELEGVLRTYRTEEDGKHYEVYEYWNDTTCEAYMREISAEEANTDLLPCMMFIDPINQAPTNVYEHGFETVPFIEFKNNLEGTSDLVKIKALIDVYDKVYSGFVNDLEDIQEIIFVLSGYGGTNLGEFLGDLKKYKTIKLDDDSSKPGIETLNIEIPVEARNSMLETTRKAIYEQGQGFDPRPENFGNQSGEALKFMYGPLEMKVGFMEVTFQESFAKLVRAIMSFNGIDSKVSIIQTWTRNSIKNDTEIANICASSVGIISKETIIKNHPFVEDPQAELEKIKAEEEEQRKMQEEMLYGDFGKEGHQQGTNKGDDE